MTRVSDVPGDLIECLRLSGASCLDLDRSKIKCRIQKSSHLDDAELATNSLRGSDADALHESSLNIRSISDAMNFRYLWRQTL